MIIPEYLVATLVAPNFIAQKSFKTMHDIHDESSQYLIESERIDTPLEILNVKAWIGLSFFILVVLGILLWSIAGKIPVTVSGKGIMIDPGSMFNVKSKYRAEVREIKVLPDDRVEEGDVLMELQLINDNTLGAIYQVTSPAKGEVRIINAQKGDLVEPGEQLFFIQKDLDVKTLKILGFVPFYPGENLKKGMIARLGFSSIKLSSYGSVEGNVGEVFPYMPDMESYYMEMLPSLVLREYLTDPLPQKMFLVNPQLNPVNPTGLSWTKGMGPPEPIQAGEIGNLQIEISYVRPISYLFPSKALKEGR